MQKRDVLILLLAVVMAAGIAVGVFLTDGIETGSWGLSFRQEGAPPLGNAARDQLKLYDAAYL